MRLGLIALLLLPALASANESWLKKDNPNEIWTEVTAKCPIISQASLVELVEGVLVRSRIRPKQNFFWGEITLRVDLNCLLNVDDVYIYRSDINFQKLTRYEDIILQTGGLINYGTYGQAGRDVILNTVKTAVENAITDYLKTNFDLGEDDDEPDPE